MKKSSGQCGTVIYRFWSVSPQSQVLWNMWLGNLLACSVGKSQKINKDLMGNVGGVCWRQSEVLLWITAMMATKDHLHTSCILWTLYHLDAHIFDVLCFAYTNPFRSHPLTSRKLWTTYGHPKFLLKLKSKNPLLKLRLACKDAICSVGPSTQLGTQTHTLLRFRLQSCTYKVVSTPGRFVKFKLRYRIALLANLPWHRKWQRSPPNINPMQGV